MSHFKLRDLLFDTCQLSFGCPNFCPFISTISSPAAQPVLFKTQLQNLERQAGETARLRCETTKPGASVVWRFGNRLLESSSKYHLKQEGTVVELVIYKLQGADSGEYSCDTGSQMTSAVLTVQGRVCLRLFFLCILCSQVFLRLLHYYIMFTSCHSATLMHEVHQSFIWLSCLGSSLLLLQSIICHPMFVLALPFNVFKALVIIVTNISLLSLITDLMCDSPQKLTHSCSSLGTQNNSLREILMNLIPLKSQSVLLQQNPFKAHAHFIPHVCTYNVEMYMSNRGRG